MRLNAYLRRSDALLTAFLVSLLPVACVTVNVNFPESAVQQATDDYVRELYRAKEKGRGNPAEATEESAKKTSFLDFSLIPEAHAEIAIRMNTPKAKEIQARQAARLDEVLAQKRSGVLGESNDGMLVIQKPEKLKKLQAKKIEKLVAEENADRIALYAEVLEASNLPKANLKDIAKSFARSFQAEVSPSGTWVQDAEGAWTQKP